MISTRSQHTNSPLSSLLYQVNQICILGYESLTIEDLLKDSLKEIIHLLKSKRGAIFLINSSTQELTLKTSIGIEKEEQKYIIQCLKDRVLAPAQKFKSPSLVAAAEHYKSFICSPLIVKDQLVGVISISHKISNRNFMQRELELLEFISSQMAFNFQRISMAQQLGQASLESSYLKRQIESQERLVSLGKLAGGIAHEFNNPLDGVMRYTNLCMSHVQDNEVLREYLTEIQQGLKRMANIVRNLLACARNEAPTNQRIEVNRAVEQALKEIYPYLLTKSIKLIKNFGKNLPEIADSGIERIVSNLVRNAVDAIDKKGTIEVTTSLDDQYIKIQVSDTGKGITNEDLNQIFEPFFTTKEIDQGCGLGLTIVNEIVKNYDGKIKVKSRPREGTTFTVKLPVKS
jgi:signal transduction histidine kinase